MSRNVAVRRSHLKGSIDCRKLSPIVTMFERNGAVLRGGPCVTSPAGEGVSQGTTQYQHDSEFAVGDFVSLAKNDSGLESTIVTSKRQT